MVEGSKAIKLPSGKTANVRKAKGRDLMRAHRAVAGHTEPMAVSFALIAELSEIDGRSILYEDVLEMDLDDVLALEAQVMEAADKSNQNFTLATDRPERANSLALQKSSE